MSTERRLTEARKLFEELIQPGSRDLLGRYLALCDRRPELREELESVWEQFQGARRGEDFETSDFASLLRRLARSSAMSATEAMPPRETPHPNDDSDRDGNMHGSAAKRFAHLAERQTHQRYILKGELGRGGMGAVLKVFDSDLRRSLAMKVILPGNGEGAQEVDEVTLARFLEEAQITSQLEHPGIVPVHDLGLDSNGQAYFTMGLVRGHDLKEIYKRVHAGDSEWSMTRTVGVLLKACEAMAYAHHKGAVHRDLKPANVMVGKYGEVYVMDWGLARVDGQQKGRDLRPTRSTASMSEVRTDRRDAREDDLDSPIITMDGTVMGTVAYMSPEQARGEVERLGPCSDVYSLGAMLYQLLTGQIPFVPPGARISPRTLLMRVIEGPPPPVHNFVMDGVPAELEAICERAMEREQEDRYSDMEAVATDLRAFLEGRVVHAYETGAWAEARKWARRNKSLAASLAAAALLLVVGLAAALYLRQEAESNFKLAEERGADLVEANEALTTTTDLAERRSTENIELARIAQENAAIATQRANDILSLSASKDLDDLVAEAETLWPAHPEMIERYEGWLANAQVLVDGQQADEAAGIKPRQSLVEHKTKLADLVARSEPETDEGRLAQAREHESYPALKQVRADLTWRRRMLGEAEWPDPREVESASAHEELPADPTEWLALARSLVGPDAEDLGQVTRGWVLAGQALEKATHTAKPKARMILAWGHARLGHSGAARASVGEALARQVALDEMAEAETSADETEGSEVQDAKVATDNQGPADSPALAALNAEANALEEFLARWEGPAREVRSAELPVLEARIRALEIEVGARVFADSQDSWWQRQLAELVAGIEALHDQEKGLAGNTLGEPFGWGVAKRAAFAQGIAERSVNGAEARRLWAQAIAAIETSERYDGLKITPQMGLLPIGADPESGLWEFAHLATGEPAVRSADRKLVLEEETGLVFVLIPGGTFLMGAQKEEQDGANYDPQAAPNEGPVHPVTLPPYFLSKYEMTQGQWRRSTASNPSNYRDIDVAPTLLHPVEQVTWTECMALMARLDLALPSEAQWENGCRGGSSTPWWFGTEREAMRGKVNIADKTAADVGAPWESIKDWPDHEDGGVVHTEVGFYPANRLGLHEVHGNVFEWCRDGYDSYPSDAAGRTDPVVSDSGSAYRVNRGGSFDNAAHDARSADRNYYSPENRVGNLGLRPAKGITTDDFTTSPRQWR